MVTGTDKVDASCVGQTDALLLNRDGLRELGITYSRSQLWRLMAKGAFPQAVRVGPNRIAWRRSEIISWINSLKKSGAS
jgi:predicted DNA-binding transcriptional regulator AlpA